MLKDQLAAQGQRLFLNRSYLPLLLVPLAIVALAQSDSIEALFGESAETTWDLMCLGVSIAGLLVRAMTAGFVPRGTSGRNTQDQQAEVLNTTGPYSVVRNPLYLGNFLVVLGFILAIKLWWFVLIGIAVFALYYERIIVAEEAFLETKFKARYTAWASRTPVFLPDLRLWTRPELPFSFRAMLVREYHTVFLIVATFTLIEIGHAMLEDRLTFGDWLREAFLWEALLGLSTVTYLFVRLLKKHTTFLVVEGR